VCGACETVAFALQPRGVEDGVSWAFIHWKWKNAGVGYLVSALVGAVVCGALAFRFGDKFWKWTNPW
jgi:hypothetical protein